MYNEAKSEVKNCFHEIFFMLIRIDKAVIQRSKAPFVDVLAASIICTKRAFLPSIRAPHTRPPT